MAKLRRVLFPDDRYNEGGDDKNVACNATKCVVSYHNPTEKRRSKPSIISFLEDSCLAQLPVSDSSVMAQTSGVDRQKAMKRQRQIRDRSVGIGSKNSQDKSFLDDNNGKCTSDCQGEQKNDETKQRRQSRVTDEEMDILGQIESFTLSSFYILGRRRGDKQIVRKRSRTSTDVVCVHKNEEMTRSSLEHSIPSLQSDSISAKKARKRLKTPSQSVCQFEPEETLESIIWHSLSTTSRKTRKKNFNITLKHTASADSSNNLYSNNQNRYVKKPTMSLEEDESLDIINKSLAQTKKSIMTSEVRTSHDETISKHTMIEEPQPHHAFDQDETKGGRESNHWEVTHHSRPSIDNNDQHKQDSIKDEKPLQTKRIPLADISSTCASENNIRLESKEKKASEPKLAAPSMDVNESKILRRSSRCRRPVDRLVDANFQKNYSNNRNDTNTDIFTNSVASNEIRTSRNKKSIETLKESKTNRAQIIDTDIPPYVNYLVGKKKEKSVTVVAENNNLILPLKSNKVTPKLGSDCDSKFDDQCQDPSEWDELTVKQLVKAHRVTDTKCVLFWHQIASKVHNKTAEQCRDKWFSLVKTPKMQRKKTAKQKTPPDSNEFDDIFNSTPMRNASKLILSWGKSSTRRKRNNRKSSSDNLLDMLLSSSPVMKRNQNKLNENKVIDSTIPSPLHFRKMTKCYVKKVRSGCVELKKDKKSRYAKASKKRQKYLSETVCAGDVHMDGTLTPNGTLTIDAPEEHEVEGLYVPSDNEYEYEVGK